jgi:hypothetical protein
MTWMHDWSKRKADELDVDGASVPAARVAAPAGVEPVLRLQAAAGNAAVAALLRSPGRGGPVVQRLWDDDEETPSGGEPEAAPAPEESPGGGADPSPEMPAPAENGNTYGAVESQVTQALDPDTVVERLGTLAASDELGDFEVPGNGVTAQALLIQRDNTPEEPKPTREGKPGDVIKALKPYLEPALKWLEENVLEALRKIKAGEAVVTVIVAAPIIIGPLTQPGPRRLALDQLDGTDVTLGLIPHFQLKPIITDGQLRGGTMTYDLAPALRRAGIPF